MHSGELRKQEPGDNTHVVFPWLVPLPGAQIGAVFSHIRRFRGGILVGIEKDRGTNRKVVGFDVWWRDSELSIYGSFAFADVDWPGTTLRARNGQYWRGIVNWFVRQDEAGVRQVMAEPKWIPIQTGPYEHYAHRL